MNITETASTPSNPWTKQVKIVTSCTVVIFYFYWSPYFLAALCMCIFADGSLQHQKQINSAWKITCLKVEQQMAINGSICQLFSIWIKPFPPRHNSHTISSLFLAVPSTLMLVFRVVRCICRLGDLSFHRFTIKRSRHPFQGECH